MKGVKPIPSPSRLQWREFRVRAVPFLVYAGVSLASVFIWTQHVTPPQMVGQVDIRQVNVAAIEAGQLASLRVAQYDTVRRGDEVAEVVVTDPRVLEGSQAVIRAELGLLRAQSDPLVARERAQVNFSRLRLEYLDSRTDLAVQKARLRFAEAEVARQTELREAPKPIISQSDYQRAVNERDALKESIEANTKLIAKIESDMSRFKLANPDHAAEPETDVLVAALALQDSRLRLAEAELKPRVLTAPMDGVVSMVYCQTGESLPAGKPILTITATSSDRIHAYVMPPWSDPPRVGATMEIVRRSHRRETAQTQVIRVGEHMEIVPVNLLSPINSRSVGLNRLPAEGATGQPVELGLPLVLALPKELGLLPGEVVSVRWTGRPTTAISGLN